MTFYNLLSASIRVVTLPPPLRTAVSAPQIRNSIRHVRLHYWTGSNAYRTFVVQPDEGSWFIQPNDGSKDVFVHISALERSDLGQLVEDRRSSLTWSAVSKENFCGQFKIA